MNALDIIVLLIIAYAFYRGFRRGLLSALLGGGALIFGFFLASTSYRLVANWLDRWLGTVEWLQTYMSNKLSLAMPSAQVSIDVVPSLNMAMILQDLPLPQFYLAEMARQLQDLTITVPVNVETLTDLVYHYLASSLWNGFVFIMLFLLLTNLAKIASKAWIGWRGEGLIGRSDQLLGGLLLGSATTLLLILVLSWFYGGSIEGASPLRVETEPLRASSLLMPYMFASKDWIIELYGGFTFYK
ncbi:CvpA family protein [Heliorestis acidaminivorans]|uniref:CvpA family protein n=1 Tax=Heliorestis acidaminivorans TaxID=553427 RepID=A0A6I0EUK2_9FIRM|nr:CvpA family protein [Heliorestis acidaminivorans]KAB2953874.1 CvpA family protein [Heliorestis acidaminivorans]